METKKKVYEAPDISLTQVEVESSICSGSVDFNKVESKSDGVVVSDQSVVDMNGTNDFSGTAWGTIDNSSN